MAILIGVAVACTSERDPYLRTLDIGITELVATDSIDLDKFNLFQARDIVPVDDEWILLSSYKDDYNLMFLNTVTNDYFMALRRGRGPGEMIYGVSLHAFGKDAAYYDNGSMTCVKINLEESIVNRKALTDTIASFKGRSTRPASLMTTCGNGFVSGNILDETIWYSYYDNTGNILSNVPGFDFNTDKDHLLSIQASSKFVATMTGDKVCVANVACPSISFAAVESGKLSEYKRIFNPPVGLVGGRVTPEHTSCFISVDADDDYVYLIYSGHKLQDDILPSNECLHLIVYDWNGDPVRRFHLDKNINSLSVRKGTVWGTSAYPRNRAYKFNLKI